MQDYYRFITVAVALAAIAILHLYFTTCEWRRRRALRRLADQFGLRFAEEDPFFIPALYLDQLWLSAGFACRASNVIFGKVGKRSVKAFDFVAGNTSGKQGANVRLSAVIIDTHLRLPALLVRPEGIKDRLGSAVGATDINFESDQFSRKFHVEADSKKFAFDVIHPRMMLHLLSDPKWILQLKGDSLIIGKSRVLKPKEIERAIKFGLGFMDLIPNYLKR